MEGWRWVRGWQLHLDSTQQARLNETYQPSHTRPVLVFLVTYWSPGNFKNKGGAGGGVAINC
ncbi:MAG: hypothetical protein QOI77_3719 [Blastocatellia bacterium]|nr:hypothetical protein [Blastocatellia bacterium]